MPPVLVRNGRFHRHSQEPAMFAFRLVRNSLGFVLMLVAFLFVGGCGSLEDNSKTRSSSSPRDRRSPPPSDLTKLFDGTTPGDKDSELKAIGSSGLMYRDLKVGDGDVCPEGAKVVMDYSGWLTDGTMFDSSWKPGREPLDMSLRQLIKGWQQGVPGMKVGGIRKLVIPPSLAYGQRGSPPAVPPNATLVFEIELLGIR